MNLTRDPNYDFVRDPEEWQTGDESITDAQREYLSALAAKPATRGGARERARRTSDGSHPRQELAGETPESDHEHLRFTAAA